MDQTTRFDTPGLLDVKFLLLCLSRMVYMVYLSPRERVRFAHKRWTAAELVTRSDARVQFLGPHRRVWFLKCAARPLTPLTPDDREWWLAAPHSSSVECADGSTGVEWWEHWLEVPPFSSLALTLLLARVGIPSELAELIWDATCKKMKLKRCSVDAADLGLVIDRTKASLFDCALALAGNRHDVTTAIGWLFNRSP